MSQLQGPHFNARHHAHGHKEGEGGGAAVAEEGKSQADDRGHVQAHAHVENGLNHEHGGDAHGDVGGHAALGLPGHPHTAQDDGKEKQQHHAAPQQPQLLSTYREDEVGVTGRQVLRQGGLGLFAVEVAHAGDLPRADGQQGAALLPSAAQGVQGVVKDHPEAHDAVVRPELGVGEYEIP